MVGYHVYDRGMRYFDNIASAREYLINHVLMTYPLMMNKGTVWTNKRDRYGDSIAAGIVEITSCGPIWIAKGSRKQVPLNDNGTPKRK